MTLAIKLQRRTPDDSKDTLGGHLIVGCVECNAALGKEWPLWGIHLTAALTYHAAHWLVAEARAIPIKSREDEIYGRVLGFVEPERGE